MQRTTEEAFEVLFEALSLWFSNNARELAWRSDPTDYHVWLSEIMLQQTRVEAVKPYYSTFLERFPTIRALAAADEEEVLKLWEGLGYYSRARNLQRCAKEACATYEGHLPADYAKLLKLPGIGSYTAGAIGSIAYGLYVPAVDGNVLRVLTRVFGREDDIARPETKKKFEEMLRAYYQTEDFQTRFAPGMINQALMELGALVCVPNGVPHCDNCPWQSTCVANQTNQTDRLPMKSKKKPRSIEKMTVFLLWSYSNVDENERILIRKRETKGVLNGLYEFPNVLGHMTEVDARAYLVNQYPGAEITDLKIRSAKHIFTHIEWHMQVVDVHLDMGRNDPIFDWGLAVTREALKEQYTLPTAFAKLL